MKVTRSNIKKKKVFLDKMKATLCNITASCEAADIARKTYYEWMKKDEKFRQAVDDLQERDIDFVESQLKKQIKEGDTTATIFYLKTKGKNRGYSERMEFTGTVTTRIEDLTDEQIKAELEQIKAARDVSH